MTSVDPAHELIQKKVQVLKQDPDFANVDESVLTLVAKKSLKKTKRVPGAAGGRPAETAPQTTNVEVPDSAYQQVIEGAGYNVEEAK